MQPWYSKSMETTAKPASEKQRQFIARLNAEREVPDGGRTPEEARIWEANFDLQFDPSKGYSTREASAVIDWLFTLPKKAEAQPEIGVYVLEDGTIVLAKPNKAGTNVYTKRWVEVPSDRITEDDEYVQGDWEYEPGLKRHLDTARKMTLDEAKEFMVRYGRCVRCSRRLKVAQSVEQGLGPVCIQYFSL